VVSIRSQGAKLEYSHSVALPMSEKLQEFLATGKDWAKVKTTVPGVFIQKLPAYRGQPARLAIEVNPVDASGAPTKRKGLLIRDVSEYEEFKEILTNDKMETVFDMLEKVNPPTKKKQRGGLEDDVIDI
jgi:hypothetical protein